MLLTCKIQSIKNYINNISCKLNSIVTPSFEAVLKYQNKNVYPCKACHLCDNTVSRIRK